MASQAYLVKNISTLTYRLEGQTLAPQGTITVDSISGAIRSAAGRGLLTYAAVGTQAQGSVQEAFTTAAIVAGVLTLDLGAFHNFNISLNASITSIVSKNITQNARVQLRLRFTADGSARTIVWAGLGTVVWLAATAPTMTSTLNRKDYVFLESWNGGSVWDGSYLQNFG